ncbi:MAG: hypothetical protein DMF24_04075 [Verrucomicrobia bacterium]|nr:MAG: hypothetical protein DME90_01955 [Verrucomicrobiota bacterium]PYL62457.1 MAG: hypothetical protein DMF24_04075 [Verrucomicrobiota bacterium]
MIRSMKRPILSGALTFGVAASALITTSCETTENRISTHPEIYQRLSANDQAMVGRGQIRPGMSQNAVWLAWGSPERKIKGNMRGHITETWIYITYETAPYPYWGSYGPWEWGYDFGPSIAFVRTRHHEHGFIFFGDPFYDPFYYAYIPQSIPVPYRIVTFADGRVVSFQYMERS